MSRGLGRVERAVLAALAQGPSVYGYTTTRALATQPYGEHPRKAQRAAMHRAVTSLTRKGLVTIRRTLGRKRCVRLAVPAGAPPCGPGRLGGGQQRSTYLPPADRSLP